MFFASGNVGGGTAATVDGGGGDSSKIFSSSNDDVDRRDGDVESVERDVGGGDGGGDCCSKRFIVNPKEKQFLNFLTTWLRFFLVNIMKLSPFAVDEIVRLIKTIGTNDNVTTLYETVTSMSHWRLATSKYKEPLFEYTIFGTMRYRLDCPLDRLVYSLLAEQSLTMVYNKYKELATDDKLCNFKIIVSYFETIRATLNDLPKKINDTDFLDNRTSRTILTTSAQWFGENTHALLHRVLYSSLRTLDLNVIRNYYSEILAAISTALYRTLDLAKLLQETVPGDSTDNFTSFTIPQQQPQQQQQKKKEPKRDNEEIKSRKRRRTTK